MLIHQRLPFPYVGVLPASDRDVCTHTRKLILYVNFPCVLLTLHTSVAHLAQNVPVRARTVPGLPPWNVNVWEWLPAYVGLESTSRVAHPGV